jgi:hypothetical protein
MRVGARTSLTAAAAAALCLAMPAGALAAAEAGDAGDLPGSAQDLTAASVEAIDGAIGAAADQDLYRVCLEGGGGFSASTVGGTELDTQLFLFDASGRGVYGNDDSQATRQSTLPAGDPLTPAAPGAYLLAISPYDRDPAGAGGEIFGGGRIQAPVGPGGGDPLTGWAGSDGAPGAYRIALTGTTACVAPDATPPTVDLRVPEDGAAVPRGAALTVDFDCADEGGSGLVSCVGSVPDGALLDTAALGARAVTVTARDAAGNETVVTHTLTVVDATAPSIALRAPVDGATYVLGRRVLADYDCADDPGGSGLTTCTGSVPSGEPLDTAAVGMHAFTVEAADAAGNPASAAAAYRVIYDWRGFRWPVAGRPALNRVRAGRTVAVRFSLAGYHGRHVLADGYPQVAEIACGSGEEPGSGDPARIRHRLAYLRWSDSYVLLWRTRRAWAGSCRQLMLGLADGTVRRADFRLKR